VKTYVIGIEGYSASSRPEEKTISAVLLDILDDMMLDYEFKELSSKRKVFREFPKYLKTLLPDTLVLVGKSMGGARVQKLYHKYFDEINRFKRVFVLFIDAHKPLLLLGVTRKLNIKKYSDKITIYNTYQRNKYPRGASIKGDFNRNVEQFDNVDHFSIIHTTITKNLIKEGISTVIAEAQT